MMSDHMFDEKYDLNMKGCHTIVQVALVSIWTEYLETTGYGMVMPLHDPFSHPFYYSLECKEDHWVEHACKF